ncbi:MAG: 50S ribosomal protein L2 [Nanoarchaeota archaeon]|nr:50S ribosomal protein L2 [Nanoarchaeota archaeon]
MGKRLIQQARGKGSSTYRAPSFRYKGSASHKSYTDPEKEVKGVIIDFVKCSGHTTPLACIEYEDGELNLMLAGEKMKVGDSVTYGNGAEPVQGNTLTLGSMPEGTLVYNLESQPGDGGKFVRSSGTFAKILTHADNNVVVMLPSKKQKKFNALCRASIGVLAAGGRTDKPILKAGKKFHMMKARNKLYPIVSGSAQNAVDHPFGNKRTSRKSKARPISKHAPPGRKVGMVGARRTGRKK